MKKGTKIIIICAAIIVLGVANLISLAAKAHAAPPGDEIYRGSVTFPDNMTYKNMYITAPTVYFGEQWAVSKLSTVRAWRFAGYDRIAIFLYLKKIVDDYPMDPLSDMEAFAHTTNPDLSDPVNSEAVKMDLVMNYYTAADLGQRLDEAVSIEVIDSPIGDARIRVFLYGPEDDLEKVIDLKKRLEFELVVYGLPNRSKRVQELPEYMHLCAGAGQLPALYMPQDARDAQYNGMRVFPGRDERIEIETREDAAPPPKKDVSDVAWSDDSDGEEVESTLTEDFLDSLEPGDDEKTTKKKFRAFRRSQKEKRYAAQQRKKEIKRQMIKELRVKREESQDAGEDYINDATNGKVRILLSKTKVFGDETSPGSKSVTADYYYAPVSRHKVHFIDVYKPFYVNGKWLISIPAWAEKHIISNGIVGIINPFRSDLYYPQPWGTYGELDYRIELREIPKLTPPPMKEEKPWISQDDFEFGYF